MAQSPARDGTVHRCQWRPFGSIWGIGIFEPRKDNQTRIVNQGVNPTDPTGSALDNPHASCASFEVFITRYSNTALRSNLCGNRVCHRWVEPAPVLCDSGVVHDHRGPARAN
jgi:hypothetical protein